MAEAVACPVHWKGNVGVGILARDGIECVGSV